MTRTTGSPARTRHRQPRRAHPKDSVPSSPPDCRTRSSENPIRTKPRQNQSRLNTPIWDLSTLRRSLLIGSMGPTRTLRPPTQVGNLRLPDLKTLQRAHRTKNLLVPKGKEAERSQQPVHRQGGIHPHRTRTYLPRPGDDKVRSAADPPDPPPLRKTVPRTGRASLGKPNTSSSFERPMPREDWQSVRVKGLKAQFEPPEERSKRRPSGVPTIVRQ